MVEVPQNLRRQLDGSLRKAEAGETGHCALCSMTTDGCVRDVFISPLVGLSGFEDQIGLLLVRHTGSDLLVS